MNEPLITVAMPIYNAGPLLRPAVLSILNQTVTRWEFLIIDDGSSDNAVACIADIKDPRIRILCDGQNKGLAARLNEAIDQARGRYFARMDQDDVSYPERFAQQMRALDEDPELDLVAVNAIRISHDSQFIGPGPAATPRHADICAKPWRGFHLHHPTWMGRTTWFRQHRYAAPAPYLCEDQEFLLRTYPVSKFAVLPEVLFAYRMPESFRLSKRLATRKSVLRMQLRHFRARRQAANCAMAILVFAARLLLDLRLLPGQSVWRKPGGRPDMQSQKLKAEWYRLGKAVGCKLNICLVATVPISVRAFLLDHIRRLQEDYAITVVTNCTGEPDGELKIEGVRVVSIPFQRKPAPLADLSCLWQLTRFLRRGNFQVVHSLMPKTGLLAMAAGRLAGIPIRIHLFTGQVWKTQRGFWRVVLKSMDRMIALCATNIYADSASQRDFLIAEKVIKAGSVLGDGSVNGVQCERFKQAPMVCGEERKTCGIAEDAVVFGFLGRLNRDKGIGDLVEAFASSEATLQAQLVLVGPDEGGIEQLLRERFPDRAKQVHFAGYTAEPERFYAAFDVFCLPSYREGFGSSVIEAAACGVPALASRIYGLTDAVVEGETGLMHEPGDVSGIRAGLERYLLEPELRLQLGVQARQRVLGKFTTQRLVDAMAAEYRKLLTDA